MRYITSNKQEIHTFFSLEDDRLFEQRFKEMGKRLKKFVQQHRTDINSFKSENLITPTNCIKYSQSECVQGTLSGLRLNRFIIFFKK